MQVHSLIRNRRGYSIGELLWVIVILSILAAMAIPRLDWMKFRLGAESRNIALQMTYAQRLAVSLQHNVQVTVDHAAKRLVVDEDKNNDGVYGSNERRRVIQLEDGVNFERNGVAALPIPASPTELTRIIFRRDGTADQAGVIFLNTGRGIALGTNKDSRAIEITRAAGRGTTYSFISGTWVKGN